MCQCTQHAGSIATLDRQGNPLEKEILGGPIASEMNQAMSSIAISLMLSGRCAYNVVKWKLAEEDKCECGAVQNMEHLLNCPNLPTQCNQEDLFAATESAIQVAKYWEKSI
ncbi:hypothetical protein WDU94_009035 [Cyamophila willieti]